MSFKTSFSPYPVKEWNKLDSETRNAEIYAFFQQLLLDFIRPIYDPLGIKLLTTILGKIFATK